MIHNEKVVRIQRYFRAKIRKKELRSLIGSAISGIRKVNYSFDVKTNNIEDQVISNANTVYIPKCDDSLKIKISTALEGICLFDKIKHYCSTKFITSILDQGLYGHKSLKSFNHEFRQASLFYDDCTNGDSNAIFFAVDKVDQRCLQENTTIITLDLEKIDLSNSNLFFKQKDLGYSVNVTSSYDGYEKFSINKNEYKFNCNKIMRIPINKHMNIQFYEPTGSILYSQLLNFEFISSNMKDMHKILVMNFFKFIDNLRDDYGPEVNFAKSFYKQLGSLDDNELQAKLKEIGKKFSKVMEFNAHGSFIIPPAAICEFTNLDTKDKLVTSLVINKLKKNEPINKEIEDFKEVFASRRYLEYLKSETGSEVIEKMLDKVERPYWFSN